MAATVLWLLRLAGPERRGRAMGHVGLANYAGLTVGPLLAQALSGQEHPSRGVGRGGDPAAGRAPRDGDRPRTRRALARAARARVGAGEPARPDRRRVLRLLRRGCRARWSDRGRRGARSRPDRWPVRGGVCGTRHRAGCVGRSVEDASASGAVSYLSMSRAADVQAAVTSRMNFACVVASEEIHSMSLLPGPRSIELAIALSAFS